jgi:hypothetical protein
MTDPVSATIGGIGMAANAAGSIFGAIGASQQGAANQAMYNYKAGIALMQQKADEQNANWAEQAGDINSMEKGLQTGQLIAATKTQQAASGFDVNTGTATRVRSSQEDASEFDQNLIKWDSSKTAYGFRVKAAMDEAESRLDTMSAGYAKQAGDINATTSILGGVSGVASKWTQSKGLGMFGQTGGFNSIFSGGGGDASA